MLAQLLAAVVVAATSPPPPPPASPPPGGSPPPPVHCSRLASTVTIDGQIVEPAWQSAQAHAGFLQRDPVEGAPPSQRTEVRVAYDDDALYVAARMWDSAPDSILARLTRRDVSVPADNFCVYLDPFHDRRSGYYFQVNAAGVLYDGTLYNDGWSDHSWDAVWEARVARDGGGWTAEMRIPYSQLRFARGGDGVWGINFSRFIQRANEEVYLQVPPKNEGGFVSRFPPLVGLAGVRPRRSIEIIPYVTGKTEDLIREPDDPFHDGFETTANGGADLRASLGSRLTLNATVNPDFGQVEVDPAVVNLSDVESFFQEKRPFFVEGNQIFRFGNEGATDYWGFNWPEPAFFYTRRIGRAPQGSAPDSQFTDVPLAATILGAAKITGKLAPGWNVGTLHAVTAQEEADLQGMGRAQAEVEPLSYYGVARTQREFPERRHGLGAMATLARRSFSTSRLENQLNRGSLMTGLDGWTFLDRNKTWVVSGWAALSHVTGTEARITDLQVSSRHYFQRPDAGYLGVDRDATSLTGHGARLWLNKERGRWISNSAIGYMSPEFDVNDVGFHTRSDVVNLHVGGGYKWTDQGRWKKYQHVIGALFSMWDFGGNRTGGGGWVASSTEFRNNVSWEVRSAYNPPSLNNRRTRGGPLMVNKPGFEIGTYLDGDGKRTRFYYLDSQTYVQPEAGSYNAYVEPGFEWKPVSNLTFRVGPGFERVFEDAQYVATVEDPTASATYGSRYVFAQLDQRTVSANLRLNCAFTPNLSVQIYAQPLVSIGRYSRYKELARGRSYAFLDYGTNGSTFDPDSLIADPDGAGPAPRIEIDRPDFNFKSLRGNAVMRWEYRPGSALFLVWTQERIDDVDDGTFRFGRSLDRLKDRKAENLFLAKLTYYLTP
jgi:hypothetical protein